MIPIQEEGAKAPFFLFYGDVIPGPNFCFELGQRLGDDRPLYIVSPPDLKNYPLHSSLEETARVLIASMRSLRPHGPYVLAGYCYGGFIAYEAARQLEAAGEPVEILILIDSFFPERRLLRQARHFLETAGARAGVGDKRQRRLFTLLSKQVMRSDFWMNLNGPEKLNYIRIKMREWLSRRARRRGVANAARVAHAIDAPNGAAPEVMLEIPLLAETLLAFQWELAGYSARPYAGRLALFLSEETASRGTNVLRGWRKLVTRMDVHLIPGNHGGCVTSHRDTLFEELKTCIARP